VKEDSLKKRYLFKVGVNFLGLPISAVSQFLIVRGLGPCAYGNFTFLTNIFNQIVGFLDAGTSIGFYTKLSQRLKESGLIKFYWFFFLAICVAVTLFLPLIFLFKMQVYFFPNQEIKYIWLALLFCLLTWSSQIVSKIVDAYGYTVNGETLRFAQRTFAVSLLAVLYFINKLNLTTLFFYHYVITLFILAAWWRLLKKNGVEVFPKVILKWKQYKSYMNEFYKYSHPLMVRSAVGFFSGVLTIWFLQKFGGSVQQGYYGFSLKLISIAGLFAFAMTPLITRELSVSFGEKNLAKMRSLFLRYAPLLYFLVCIMSSFFFTNAENISVLFGGDDFRKAKMAFAIMAFYPLIQTYGQLTGSFFYATGKTKLYRNIGLMFSLFGVPMTFILLGPKSMYGLNLGSVGMSLEMVILGFISVNTLLWFVCKYLKMSFIKFFVHQIYSVFVLILVSLSSSYVVGLFIVNDIVSMLLSGFVYVILVVLLVVIIPNPLIFMNRKELLSQVKSVYLAIRRSKEAV